MKKNLFFFKFFLPALLLTVLTSCKKEVMDLSLDKMAVSDADNSRISGGESEKKLETDLLKSVRSATSRFHSTKQAIAAGYTPDDHCVSAPGLGGNGLPLG